MKRYVNVLLQLASVAALIAIIILSTVPGNERPHTGASGQSEHFIAYLGTAMLYGLWVTNIRYLVFIGAGLLACAGLLEILQIVIPGRNAQVIDFASGAGGIFIGLFVGLKAAKVFGIR